MASTDTRTAELGAGSVSERMDQLADLVSSVVPADSQLLGVGCGASGPVDVAAGTIDNPDTLPWFSGFPFVEELQRRIGVPVSIDNDAVAAALGELACGAGQGVDRLLMVTLGTGVGVAFLVDGKPFRGREGAHPEGGHLPVWFDGERCYCGLVGCWEQVASRASLQRYLADVLGVEPHRELLSFSVGRPETRGVFTAYGRAVGRGLATLHALYQPRATVLGGSAGAFLSQFEAGVREELRRTPNFDVAVELRVALLGDDAGAIGAATGLA